MSNSKHILTVVAAMLFMAGLSRSAPEKVETLRISAFAKSASL